LNQALVLVVCLSASPGQYIRTGTFIRLNIIRNARKAQQLNLKSDMLSFDIERVIYLMLYRLGLSDVITVQCRDVCGKTSGTGGFSGVEDVSIDAVFLDLPEPVNFM
jgi:hypothetical protein